MRKFSSLLAIVLPLGLLIAGAPPAAAFTITQTQPTVTACVAVKGASTADLTPIVAAPCDDRFKQQWIYHNGQFLVTGTADGTTRCLTVPVPQLSLKAPPPQVVVLDDCNRSPTSVAHLWVLFAQGHTFSQLFALGGQQLCLDSGGNIGDGFQLAVDTCKIPPTSPFAPGQHWYLR